MKLCPQTGRIFRLLATWRNCPGCDLPFSPLPPRREKLHPHPSRTPAPIIPKAVTDTREELQDGQPSPRHTCRAPCKHVHACSLPWDPGGGGDAVSGQGSQHPNSCLADPWLALASVCLLELEPEKLRGPPSERGQASLPGLRWSPNASPGPPLLLPVQGTPSPHQHLCLIFALKAHRPGSPLARLF